MISYLPSECNLCPRREDLRRRFEENPDQLIRDLLCVECSDASRLRSRYLGLRPYNIQPVTSNLFDETPDLSPQALINPQLTPEMEPLQPSKPPRKDWSKHPHKPSNPSFRTSIYAGQEIRNLDEEVQTHIFEKLEWSKIIKSAKTYSLVPGYLASLHNLQQGLCAYTKLPYLVHPKGLENRHPQGVSVDRVDNRKGYVPGNVVLCCWFVNVAKNKWDIETLKPLWKHLATVQNPLISNYVRNSSSQPTRRPSKD